jgi:hypothetical protein
MFVVHGYPPSGIVIVRLTMHDIRRSMNRFEKSVLFMHVPPDTRAVERGADPEIFAALSHQLYLRSRTQGRDDFGSCGRFFANKGIADHFESAWSWLGLAL